MLTEIFSNVLRAIANFFTWIWDAIASFFGSLWKIVWNNSIDLFWDYYGRVVNWFVSAVAYLFPLDGVDFEDQTDMIVQQIGAWDTLLPIHETFYILHLLLGYWFARSSVGYALKAVKLVKKLMPF